ncbi:MAG: hypothetical protein E7269_00205 [Lachnospiraceae bacterium]|nr:hypothetical protein [Lachnospiraceae bacterium]
MNFKFFDLNHPLYQFMLKLVWVFVFNAIFLFTCIPIITIGPSAVGCASVFLKVTENRSGNWFKEYGMTVMKRLGVSLVYGILALLVVMVVMADFSYFSRETGIIKIIGIAVAVVIAAIAAVFFLGVFYITAKFKYGIIDTGRATVYFLSKNMKMAIAAALMFYGSTIGMGLLMILIPYLTWTVVIFMGFGFFCAAYAYNAIFRRYFDEDEEELDFTEEEINSFYVLCERLEKYGNAN